MSRLVSSQKERDFVNTNYDDIKQVFSIWICMNMASNSMSHIHLIKDEMLEPYDWKGNMDLLNIVLIGITDVSNEIREDVRVMCNLSTGIEERAEERATKRATEKTSEKFILNMYKKGYTLEQIADVAEISVDAVEAVIQKKASVMA